jgi:hypothetical protein
VGGQLSLLPRPLIYKRREWSQVYVEVHACNPSTWEVAGELRLHSKFKVSLDYIPTPCLKKTNKQTKNKGGGGPRRREREKERDRPQGLSLRLLTRTLANYTTYTTVTANIQKNEQETMQNLK